MSNKLQNLDEIRFKPLMKTFLAAINTAIEKNKCCVEMPVHDKKVTTHEDINNSEYLEEITILFSNKGVALTFYEHTYEFPYKIVVMMAKATWELPIEKLTMPNAKEFTSYLRKKEILDCFQDINTACELRDRNDPFYYVALTNAQKAAVKLDDLIFKPLFAEALKEFDEGAFSDFLFKIEAFSPDNMDESELFVTAFEESLYVKYEKSALEVKGINFTLALPLLNSKHLSLVLRRK